MSRSKQTVKRSSRTSEKRSKEDAAVKEEAATQQEQRSVRRKAGTLNGDGEAGPSNRQASQAEDMAEETAHMIKMRDFYKEEAERVEAAPISTEEGEQLVAAVMRHMLFRQHQKPDQPVRRDELNKIIQNSYKAGRKVTLGNFIIANAQAKFPVIFGLEMKQIDLVPAAKAGGNTGATPAKAYVLRSLLPAPLRARALADPGADPARAFALVVIAVLNMNGGAVSKDALWELLDKLAVVEGTAHPALGKPEDQIEGLLKKRYLVEQHAAGANGPSVTYHIGENALDEIPSDQLKAFIDQVLAAPQEDEEAEEEEEAAE